MIHNYTLISLAARHPGDALAQTIAPTPEDALSQLASELNLRVRLEICERGALDAEYRLERATLGWSSVEETWDIRAVLENRDRA